MGESKTKINIVIADNNKDFCNILNDYLITQDDMIISGIAGNGIEALELIKEKKPDLIVLDIIMPILDGLGVIEKLNALDLSPMPRIIILSSVSQDKIIQKATLLGADYYVVKPFDIDIFIRRIRHLINNTLSNHEIKKIPMMS